MHKNKKIPQSICKQATSACVTAHTKGKRANESHIQIKKHQNKNNNI